MPSFQRLVPLVACGILLTSAAYAITTTLGRNTREAEVVTPSNH